MPTVVIADDSPTLRRIVTTVLEREGFTVVQAEDGVEAVQMAFREQPDAVVLDVQMPRVSGYVAARVLKDDWQTADIPVLLLTSLDAASDRYWGSRVGADRYLTKDFEAPDLVAAVNESIAAHAPAKGERNLRPEPLELSDDDVLARVCDLLDRKLFEASIASEVLSIATDVRGFEETVATFLEVLASVVDYDMAGILMLDDLTTYVAVARETSFTHYQEFCNASADAATQVSGHPVGVEALSPLVTDPLHYLGVDEDGRMATFLSMPLKTAGRIVGVVALSSSVKNAFGEMSLATLRLIESPAAIVIDNARLSAQPVHHVQ